MKKRIMNPKKAFGRMLRKAREKKRLSRAVLGMRIGVHWKTVQSWEDGRTFPEDLSIIPPLEREIGVSVAEFFARLSGCSASSRPQAMGARPVHFNLRDKGADENDWLAVPLVQLAERVVANTNDIPFKTLKHIVVPASWAEGVRTKNLLAFAHSNKQMEPVIPYRAIVVVNASAYSDTKFQTGDLVAGFINGRGVRIRYVWEDEESNSRAGESYTLVPLEGKCGFFPVRPKKDRILGRVVGMVARPAPYATTRFRPQPIRTIRTSRTKPRTVRRKPPSKPSQRSLDVMRLRKEGRSQKEIAHTLGVTRQRVHQILKHAIETHGFKDLGSLPD